jgi:hypothetical protein
LIKINNIDNINQNKMNEQNKILNNELFKSLDDYCNTQKEYYNNMN